jgi:hypothetical protein
MKIAVIEAGRVGSALGVGWAKRGHEVVFGVRELRRPTRRLLCSTRPLREGRWAVCSIFAFRMNRFRRISLPECEDGDVCSSQNLEFHSGSSRMCPQ